MKQGKTLNPVSWEKDGEKHFPCKVRAFPPAKKWGKTMSFPTLHENLILSKLS
ncbi:MAG: hypothetical protein ACLR1T_04430 [Evtepia gabavorous]